MKLAMRMLFVCLVASICSGPAFAGLFRAYLASYGDDTHSCNVANPCRLLPAALAAVNAGGQIWILDSANYNIGPVTINKSVTILAIPGAVGSVAGVNGDAIFINAPGSSVTLRNLDVSNLSAGVNGINIADADAVHIEKVSLGGFATDASSCINLSSASIVRVWVVDSFIRECHVGIHVNGTDPTLTIRPTMLIDNTRIERGNNTGAATGAGVWMQGLTEVSLRNSTISRHDVAVQFDGPPGPLSRLEIFNSEIFRATVGLLFNNTSFNGVGQITITGSQFMGMSDAIMINNTAAAGQATVSIADSTIQYAVSSGLQVHNTASDNNSSLNVNVVRSTFANLSTVAMDLLASNGSKIQLSMRDSTLAKAGTLLKTAGGGAGGDLHVDLVRSTMSESTTAIDHGFGRIRLDGTHVTYNANDFVNNGSGNIQSIGNNFVTDNTNGSGFTYITATIIAPK